MKNPEISRTSGDSRERETSTSNEVLRNPSEAKLRMLGNAATQLANSAGGIGFLVGEGRRTGERPVATAPTVPEGPQSVDVSEPLDFDKDKMEEFDESILVSDKYASHEEAVKDLLDKVHEVVGDTATHPASPRRDQ
jgi:hypothetical protein